MGLLLELPCGSPFRETGFWNRHIKKTHLLRQLSRDHRTLSRLLFVVASLLMLGGALPMWAEGQAMIYRARIKTKNLIKFNKHLLSSNLTGSHLQF